MRKVWAILVPLVLFFLGLSIWGATRGKSGFVIVPLGILAIAGLIAFLKYRKAKKSIDLFCRGEIQALPVRYADKSTLGEGGDIRFKSKGTIWFDSEKIVYDPRGDPDPLVISKSYAKHKWVGMSKDNASAWFCIKTGDREHYFTFNGILTLPFSSALTKDLYRSMVAMNGRVHSPKPTVTPPSVTPKS